MTPHAITILNMEKEVVLQLPKPEIISLPRVSVDTKVVDNVLGVPVLDTVYGSVTDLPEEEKEVILIVSALVRLALPHRKDLASPGQLVRDDKGLPIGAQGLSMNR